LGPYRCLTDGEFFPDFDIKQFRTSHLIGLKVLQVFLQHFLEKLNLNSIKNHCRELFRGVEVT
jgi:hypothetical protein